MERPASVEQACGRRAVVHAACGLVYGKNDAPKSPEPKSAVLTDGELVIDFAGGPLYTLDGDEPREFELVWEDGSVHAVSGRVEGDKVVIRVALA